MLHAWLLGQSGVPILYAGDEIGQRNDYSYRDDPQKAEDSRYIHRGAFDWAQSELRHDPATRQGKLFQGLRKLEKIRCEQSIFSADADVAAFDAGNTALLGIRRRRKGRTLTMVYNFSEHWQHAELNATGFHVDLVRGETIDLVGTWELPPYGFVWLLKE